MTCRSQFGFLQQIANELASETPSDYNIEILGISWGPTVFDSRMTDGRDLPWLQDPTGGAVTIAWEAQYRDFVILDPANEKPVAAYNLTANSLEDPANRAELKAILRGVAVLKDDDNDKLSDFWEDEVFDGDHSNNEATDDRDSDSANELLEYGLGSDAGDPDSLPITRSGNVAVGEERFQAILFRRRLGAAGGLIYVVEFSRDLVSWSTSPTDVVEVESINPYDGTGTEIVLFRGTKPLPGAQGSRGYMRVRVICP